MKCLCGYDDEKGLMKFKDITFTDGHAFTPTKVDATINSKFAILFVCPECDTVKAKYIK